MGSNPMESIKDLWGFKNHIIIEFDFGSVLTLSKYLDMLIKIIELLNFIIITKAE